MCTFTQVYHNVCHQAYLQCPHDHFFYEKKLVRYDKEKARDLGQKFQADKMYLWIHKENELIIDCLIMEVNMFL